MDKSLHARAHDVAVRLGLATILKPFRSAPERFFFVVAMGRSGTRFLSRLLNRAPGARVMHEPTVADALAYQEAFHDEMRARDYIQRYRKHDIALRAGRPGVKVYGEVNSFLRRHVRPLKEAFPTATIIHVIRDGRAVVRSMVARETMTARDGNTRLIHPKEEDPCFEQWSSMSRFERLCWYWQVENRYLAATADWSVRFEDLIGDYGTFRESMAGPCGCEIARETWEHAVAIPVNVTRTDATGFSSEWTTAQEERFWELCGTVMDRHGYARVA